MNDCFEQIELRTSKPMNFKFEDPIMEQVVAFTQVPKKNGLNNNNNNIIKKKGAKQGLRLTV